MSIVMELNPFEFFVDANGTPLDNGSIWIGEVNKDPRYYPVIAYYDSALTIPAPMPLKTSNGYIARRGTPSLLYINGNYSIMVLDKKGRQVYYVPDFLMIGSQSAVSAGDLANETDMNKGVSMVGGGARVVPTLAALKALIPPIPTPGRIYQANTLGYFSASDGGESSYQWNATSTAAGDDFTVVVPNTLPAAGRWLIVNKPFIRPEQAGAIGDYVFQPVSGTVNTVALQKLLNYCSINGTEIKLSAGKKYLTDTLYFYKDLIKNPGWSGRPGRIKIVGQSNGLATGEVEPQGCAICHINNAPRNLIECIGSFSVADPAAAGGYISFEDMNFIGGNATTNVILFQAVNSSTFLKNYTVRVRNPAGNGITESTTWEAEHHNGLIKGNATGLGTWTGIGLNLITDGSIGQVNMKIYNNVDCYGMGYGIRIGRRGSPDGTFGPLIFIGGQTAWSDYYGMWLDGGTYNLVSIGQQHEQARFNGIRIASDGATDIPRNIKFINTYLTHCGKVADGSVNEFSIYNIDGVNVEFDSPLFQNTNSGILFDQGQCENMLIRRPVFRTTTAYGLSSGRGIVSTGTYVPRNRVRLIDPTFNNGFNVNIQDLNSGFASSDNGIHISFSSLSATPTISLGNVTGNQSARVVNFNNASAVTVTNILGAQLFQTATITFSNANTTIQRNSNIALNGSDFVPSSARSVLVLYFDGIWKEVSRSLNA